MVTWSEFAAARPDLAAAGRELFYQVGVGLGFISTVRADGGPRLNPMCPVLADSALFEFSIGRVLLTRTTGHGDPAPQYTIWHASG